MTPSPQYDAFKKNLEDAEAGDAKAIKIVRYMIEAVALEEDTPVSALVRIGKLLLTMREEETRLN